MWKLRSLIETVKKNNCDLGIAHDGDADRCLAIDSSGNVIDGDHILALLAQSTAIFKPLRAPVFTVSKT